MDEPFEDLVESYLDGELTPEETAALEARLQSSDEVVDEFWRVSRSLRCCGRFEGDGGKLVDGREIPEAPAIETARNHCDTKPGRANHNAE